MDKADQDTLEWAAETLVNRRGLVMHVAQFVGGRLDRAARLGGVFASEGMRRKFDAAVEDAMWHGYRVAIAGLGPDRVRRPWLWLHKAMVSVSGAASGFLGVPGLAVDLPVTTALMLRSVAEIARSKGEDIASDDTRRACLEVVALGGPAIEDDEAEKGYWAARVALNFLPVDRLVAQAARMFGAALSQKLLAQAVPGIGALAGGGLNYMFMDYYQQMARVHFSLRDLERRYGAELVRGEFEALVRAARERRAWGARKEGRGAAPDPARGRAPGPRFSARSAVGGPDRF